MHWLRIKLLGLCNKDFANGLSYVNFEGLPGIIKDYFRHRNLYLVIKFSFNLSFLRKL